MDHGGDGPQRSLGPAAAGRSGANGQQLRRTSHVDVAARCARRPVPVASRRCSFPPESARETPRCIGGRAAFSYRFSSSLFFPECYFGIRLPYGGPGEAVAVGLFGGMLLVSIVVAFVAIRRRQIARHREWMIRVFALVVAIATERFVFAAFDTALTPSGVPPPTQFVLSVWTAWIVTLAAAEAWIRYTRAASESGIARERVPPMAISIVRLGSTRQRGEGLRIGTVRRPPRGVPKSKFASEDWYDVWLPTLSPSAALMRTHVVRRCGQMVAGVRPAVPGRAQEARSVAPARRAGGVVAPDKFFDRLLL